MNLRELIGPLGMLTVIFFGVALLNFFVKFINKNYINKLGKDKKNVVDAYRKVMRFVVKYHKLAGILAVVCMMVHFFIAYSAHFILINGVVALVIMLVVSGLGIYGVYISKNMRGNWLKIHRILAFVLLLAIIVHAV